MLQAGNKPWHQGTTGPLRRAKATSYEGDARAPAMIRWPDQIEAGIDLTSWSPVPTSTGRS